MQGPLLFIININGLDNNAVYMVSKVEDNPKIGSIVDSEGIILLKVLD